MRANRKIREGLVVSDKMEKTVVVQIERRAAHPKYKKYLTVRKKVKAHDGENACRVGDKVLIVETRPLSRDKRWAVHQIVQKATK